jgi:hypothetical protein
MAKVRLTPDQKRILIVLSDALVPIGFVKLRCTQAPQYPIREPTTGCALVRKGLAVRRRDGRFLITEAGLERVRPLYAEDELGKIPRRREPS